MLLDLQGEDWLPEDLKDHKAWNKLFEEMESVTKRNKGQCDVFASEYISSSKTLSFFIKLLL